MSSAPIVLLHAFPVDRRVWLPVAQELENSGSTVFAPDFRGFGSDVRQIPVRASLDALADDVAEQIMRLGEPAIVGGLSLGGYVAMNVLRRHPDQVAGLILADTKASADPQEAAQGRLAFADRVDQDGSGWVAEAMMPKLLGPRTRASDPQVVDAVTAMIDENDPKVIAWVQRAMAARPDSFDVIRDFDGPVLGIVGSDDVLSTPAEVAKMVAVAANGTLATIPDSGHLTTIEAPNQVAAVIASWLRSI